MDIRLDAAAKRPLYLQLRDQLRARLLSRRNCARLAPAVGQRDVPSAAPEPQHCG